MGELQGQTNYVKLTLLLIYIWLQNAWLRSITSPYSMVNSLTVGNLPMSPLSSSPYLQEWWQELSLTSIPCKLLEHIVFGILLEKIDGFLHSRQHGSRKGLSCETQTCATMHDILSAAEKRLEHSCCGAWLHKGLWQGAACTSNGKTLQDRNNWHTYFTGYITSLLIGPSGWYLMVRCQGVSQSRQGYLRDQFSSLCFSWYLLMTFQTR